jgi:hypothetical protein
LKISWEMSLLNRHIQFKYWKENTLNDVVIGINSNLTNNNNTESWYKHHFLMIDYDDILSLSNLITEIERLQEKYKLPTAYIFESSFRHYFVFFFDVDRDYFDLLRIVHDTPCCKEFKKWRMIRQEFTLRLTPKSHYEKKPKLVSIVESNYRDPTTKRIRREQRKIKEFVMSVCDSELLLVKK